MKASIRRVTCAVILLGHVGAVAAVTRAHAVPLPPNTVDAFIGLDLPSFTAPTVLQDTGSLNYSFGGNTRAVGLRAVSNATGALCRGRLTSVCGAQVAAGSVGG